MITIFNTNERPLNIRASAALLDEAARTGHAEIECSHAVAQRVARHSSLGLHAYAPDGTYLRVLVAVGPRKHSAGGYCQPSLIRFSAL